MPSIHQNKSQKCFYVFLTALASSISVRGLSAESSSASSAYVEDIDDYFSFLSNANHYSAMEGAGSHGSLGIGLGVGASQHSMPKHTRLIDDQVRSSDQFSKGEERSTGGEIMVPRVYFHKGLPWPVDFGLTAAKLPDTSATTAGGYLQWTIYESFAMPAVAVRGKYSRMMGLPSTEFDSTCVEGVASYGFFKILTAYANLGLNYNRATIKTAGESSTTLALTQEHGEELTYSARNQNLAFGLQAQIIPQFFVASIENRRVGNEKSWLAKLSVGL